MQPLDRAHDARLPRLEGKMLITDGRCWTGEIVSLNVEGKFTTVTQRLDSSRLCTKPIVSEPDWRHRPRVVGLIDHEPPPRATPLRSVSKDVSLIVAQR